MSTTSTHPHADFVTLLPAIERHANYVFRGKPPFEREEATAVAAAAAFANYVRLATRTNNPVRDFASGLVTYGVLHAASGRQVGSRNSTTDALSPLARRKRGFRLESLGTGTVVPRDVSPRVRGYGMQDVLEERLRDNVQTPVPDQAAFRVDFPDFLSRLGPRDRELAEFLAMGNAAVSASARFGLTTGRISQLRRTWREQWQREQGELTPRIAAPSA